MACSTPGSSVLTISRSLLRWMSFELVMLSNHCILCGSLLLLPSVFPRVFSSDSALHIRWPKYLLFSCSVVSDSLQPHGLQHTRLPHPSPSPGAYSNSGPLSWMMPSNHLILCHPLLLPSIFPSIRVFSNESTLYIRWPKYWRFSTSPSSEYSGLIPLGLTSLISLLSKGLSRVFSNTTV